LATNNTDDAQRFCELSNSLYKRQVDPAYYAWQFFGGPHATVLCFAVQGTRVVGSVAYQVRSIDGGGPGVAWLVDIMVAPSFQRKGVFTALHRFAFANMPGPTPCALAVMGNANADETLRRLGWERVNVFRTFLRSTAGTPASDHGVVLERLSDFNRMPRSLFEADLRGAGLVRSQRSREALTWRFVENPRYAYEVHLATSGVRELGCVVLKVFRDPVSQEQFGDIVDVIAPTADSSELEQLLIVCLERFRAMGVRDAATWLQTNTPLDRAGQLVGFRPTPQERFFCVQPLDAGRTKGLLDAAGWCLTMADAEIY
jgi:hypothetical protein